MRRRRVHSKLCWPRRSEEQPGNQPTACHTPGEVAAACIEASKRQKEAIRRDVTITTENAIETLPEIGDHNDVCLVIARAGFDPCVPFAHLVGSSQVCVPIS